MGRPPRTRAGRAAGAALAAAAAIAVAATPAAAWEPPVALTPGTPATEGPYLAVGDAGDAVVAWGRGTPTSAEGGPPQAWRVEAATRPAGAAAWSAPQRLSPAGELAYGPVVAMPPSGVPVVAWTTVRRGVADVTVSEARGESTGWVTVPLDLGTGYSDGRATAAAPDGTLAVATVTPWWARGRWLRLQVREPGGLWRAPALLPGTPDHLAVAVRPGGRTLVAWLEQVGDWESADVATRLVTREWDPEAGWRPAVVAATVAGGAADFRMGTTADGTVLAVALLHGEDGWEATAVTRAPDGRWGPPQVLGRPDDSELQMAATPAAGAVAAWTEDDRVRAVTWTAAAGWSAVEEPPTGTCARPQQVEAVAAGPHGEALVVATAGFVSDWYHGAVRAWARRADGTWIGPAWLSRPVAGSPAAAIDGSGRMHVAWSRESDRPARIEVTSTDPAGSAADAVADGPVEPVLGVRAARRGRRALAVRFRLAHRARVRVVVQRLVADRRIALRSVTVRGRRGGNAVVVRLDEHRAFRPGRFVASVWEDAVFVRGCPVASPTVRVP